jgi:hypothetical protein
VSCILPPVVRSEGRGAKLEKRLALRSAGQPYESAWESREDQRVLARYAIGAQLDKDHQSGSIRVTS